MDQIWQITVAASAETVSGVWFWHLTPPVRQKLEAILQTSETHQTSTLKIFHCPALHANVQGFCISLHTVSKKCCFGRVFLTVSCLVDLQLWGYSTSGNKIYKLTVAPTLVTHNFNTAAMSGNCVRKSKLLPLIKVLYASAFMWDCCRHMQACMLPSCSLVFPQASPGSTTPPLSGPMSCLLGSTQDDPLLPFLLVYLGRILICSVSSHPQAAEPVSLTVAEDNNRPYCNINKFCIETSDLFAWQ